MITSAQISAVAADKGVSLSAATVAAAECVRQHVGIERLVTLLDAVMLASTWDGPLSPEQIVQLGGVAEPDNGGRFRTSPVTFSGGGSSAHSTDIPRLVQQLCEFYASGNLEVGEFTKELLWVHPFSDGNGRTAWVVFNYLNGTLDDPAPLPYFFGEAPVEQA